MSDATNTTTTQVLDLDGLADDFLTVARMTVMDPRSGEPSPMWIDYAGPGHPQYDAEEDRIIRRALRERVALDKARVTGGRSFKVADDETDPAAFMERNIASHVNRIVDWGGASIPFTKEAAKKFFRTPPGRLIMQQGEDFMATERRFTKTSAKN